jgi:signal transduction histidine kinase
MDNSAPSAASSTPVPAGDPAAETEPRGRLFRRYLFLILALVTGALLIPSSISLYFSYQETLAALHEVQQEKANGAASRIEQYIVNVHGQLRGAALPQLGADAMEQRRLEFLKLLTRVPDVTDVAYMAPDGCEKLRVSRLEIDQVGECLRQRGDEPVFREPTPNQPFFGPVYFRKDTEPYMPIAVRSGGEKGAVAVAEVNLKFMWDVVTRIRIGEKGLVYVVDNAGYLIAHPDIGRVLQKYDMSQVPHVKRALGSTGESDTVGVVRDADGTDVLSSYARIPTLGWRVFAEQPAAVVFSRLRESLVRTGILLLGGLAISAFAALFLARGMVRPIRAMQESAQLIGEGQLDHRLDIRTGDELQTLANQFNRMTARLAESYASLERKVEERTRELSNSLDQQTAISDILRVISSSPTDVKPVLEAVAERAAHLCEAPFARVMLVQGDFLHPQASYTDPKRTMTIPGSPVPLDRSSISGRAAVDRKTVHIADVLPVVDSEFFGARNNILAMGIRAALAVPLMREGGAYGAIFLFRGEPRAFSPDQIALVETFARQAAIAVENVRLFNETREALEQQKASGEVLAAISNSIADTQPVFETILSACERLFEGKFAVIDIVGDDGQVHLGAYHGQPLPADRPLYPHSADASSATGLAITTRTVVHYPRIDAPEVPEVARRAMQAMGIRATIGAPMIWEGKGIGAIWVARDYAGPFGATDIALLRTFADQAVIAIQNARLFREIQDKSRQLEIANQHKSEFLANMSHELRTPLNAIIGFSEVLIERMFGELNEKQDDYLKDILSSGRHLLMLINDILDLAKVEAGRMELEPTRFHIPTAIDNAMTLVRERAQRHGIALGHAIDASLDHIVADERKFKQILLNLLTNAVKFTPDGGKVDVLARRAGDVLEVAVRDTGIGIAEADQEAVFEEFRQVGRHYTNKQEGTGLGLTLTRRFVELHGGTIRLASEPGKGSTFTFTIPFRDEAEGEGKGPE